MWQSKSLAEVTAPTLRSCYTATKDSLRIGSHTKVICQGFTGKQASRVFTFSVFVLSLALLQGFVVLTFGADEEADPWPESYESLGSD